MRYFAQFIIIVFLFSSCNRKLENVWVLSPKSIIMQESTTVSKAACKEPLSYVPDEKYPLHSLFYQVNINFHFVDGLKGKNNFDLTDGIQYFKYMINNANDRLQENFKMNLPLGNTTKNIPPLYKYVIKPSPKIKNDNGFYHHRDKDPNVAFFLNKGDGQNNYSDEVFKYAVEKDSILNIFVMSYPPDIMSNRSNEYYGAGIALGSCIKVGGIFQKGGPDWAYATLINHEIGHAFNLYHAWQEDGCGDTPNHRNCYGDGIPPCTGLASNNMMDYNNSQMAITPCQIGTMRMAMADNNSFQRKLLVPTWCNLDTSKTIYISDDVTWQGARDIEGDLIIKSGGKLHICCRLSMPQYGKITVEPGGKLILDNIILHNSCGKEWLGIEVLKKGRISGKVTKIGEVVMEGVGE